MKHYKLWVGLYKGFSFRFKLIKNKGILLVDIPFFHIVADRTGQGFYFYNGWDV